MSSTVLHLAIGLAAGSALFIKLPVRAFLVNGEAAHNLSRWIAWAWGLGAFATVPNLLAAAGVPYILLNGWWSNIFLFHHLIDSLKSGGDLIGELGVSALAVLQYCIVVAVLVRIRRRARLTAPAASD